MSKKPSACIIDDDDIYQFTMKAILKKRNAFEHIYIFDNGDEAMSYFLDHCDATDKLPDVIFLDIDMPVLDGFQFMEQYNLLKPRVKKDIIIYMTSSSLDPKDYEKATKLQDIVEYIVKPIEDSKLTQIIEKLHNV
ncbi:two-component system response regulator [Croceivirga sp. JEA036]|uniref:response regulator n=1 Tax=Croceivirga sp. JEA036 TaxID=2721162 RepID=UPI00143C7F01|nr:response regulator [Croceivirga sp. JEA036]NJB37206.1 response regulator [Croceivirga sp. JEA036]